MIRRKKLWIVIFIIISICLSMLLFTQKLKGLIVQGRQQEAQTTLELFREQLLEKLEHINYAEQLSFTLEDNDVDKDLFQRKATQLLNEYSYIAYLAYFNADTLDIILPEEEFGINKGRTLQDFAYSYTLAKVVKNPIIDGPITLETNGQEVFLFIEPIFENDVYKGEIVSAIDKNYVIQQIGWQILSNGGYDYEAWKVNELGEHKIMIATSNETIDFSNAKKINFSLPAEWTISIQPTHGWISTTEKMWIYGISSILCFLMISLALVGYAYIQKKMELLEADYRDPDSKLYNLEGFTMFVDHKFNIEKRGFLLFIHLQGFRELSALFGREETSLYYQNLHHCVQGYFGNDVIAGKLDHEHIVLALFEDAHDEKVLETIEDFMLQLIWKKKLDQRKVFVDPTHRIAIYSEDGQSVAQLLSKGWHSKQEKEVEITQ